MKLLVILIDFYTMIVFAVVLMSWVKPPRDHPVVKFLNSAVDPVLAPIKKALPSTGGIDFSPMVLLVGLMFLKRLLGG